MQKQSVVCTKLFLYQVLCVALRFTEPTSPPLPPARSTLGPTPLGVDNELIKWFRVGSNTILALQVRHLQPLKCDC